MIQFHELAHTITSNTICPRPFSLPMGAQAPRVPSSRRNVAVFSHDEYVPTLTAADALRVKAALSKAVWSIPAVYNYTTFELLLLKVVFESRVTWAISVPILVLGLFSTRSDVRDRQSDRQTDVRQKHRLMPLPMGRGINDRHVCIAV